jgi:hypothetical protein
MDDSQSSHRRRTEKDLARQNARTGPGNWTRGSPDLGDGQLARQNARFGGRAACPSECLNAAKTFIRSNAQPIRLVRLVDPINFSFRGAASFESWIASASITTTPEVSLHCLFFFSFFSSLYLNDLAVDIREKKSKGTGGARKQRRRRSPPFARFSSRPDRAAIEGRNDRGTAANLEAIRTPSTTVAADRPNPAPRAGSNGIIEEMRHFANLM